MKHHLGVFAKYWEPGRVKTRLAETIGGEKAALVYRAFVKTTLTRLTTLNLHNVLAFAPDDDFSKEQFSVVGGEAWELLPQAEGDLGVRMRAFFEDQLSIRARSTVLLGSDSPNVPLEYLKRAFQELEKYDVVLGPSEDGGYYLIGISRSIPPLFDDMPWSKSNLWNTSIDRLERARIRYTTLDSWYDVDEMTDLERLRADLAGDTSSDSNLLRLSQELDEILTP